MTDARTLDPRHLDIIRTEGARLAAMPPDRLDAPVPSIEGWNLERVVRHVGKVHRWVTGVLTASSEADIRAISAGIDSLPKGPDALPAYRAALEAMCEAFTAVDPDKPVATFTGPGEVAFWLRRQAHEVTVHRIDAADAVHAAGGAQPEPVDASGATDGVAEWLEVFAAAAREPALAGHSYGVTVEPADPADQVTSWMLQYPAEGPATVRPLSASPPETAGDAEPQVVISGPPGAVLLTLWRRRPLAALVVTGERHLAEELLESVRP